MQCHGIHAVSLQLLMAGIVHLQCHYWLIERQIQPERVFVMHKLSLYDNNYARANFYAKIQLISLIVIVV